MTILSISACDGKFYTVANALARGDFKFQINLVGGTEMPDQVSNHRKGGTRKTVLTSGGRVLIQTPLDREGRFEPLPLARHAPRFTAFDDSIAARYARGLTMREVQGYLLQTDATEISPQLISTVTDSVLAAVTTQQSRPLEAAYPMVFFHTLRVKIERDAAVRDKAAYLVLGVCGDDTREILGLSIETTAGAKFCMNVFS